MNHQMQEARKRSLQKNAEALGAGVNTDNAAPVVTGAAPVITGAIAAAAVAAAAKAAMDKLNEQKKTYFRAQVAGFVSRVSSPDTQCVVCQFIVERVRAEMLLNGIGGTVPFGVRGNVVSSGKPEPAASSGSSSSSGSGSSAGSGSSSSFLEAQSQLDSAVVSGAFVSAKMKNQVRAKAGRAQSQAQSQAQSTNPFWVPTPDVLPFMPHPMAPPVQRTSMMWRTKRERNEDIQIYKPTQTRYSNMYDGPMNAELRAQERFENNQIYAVVYQVVEEICTKRMPKPFFAYCGEMLRKFQNIADGLRWRDRPDAICMSLNFCSASSYIQQGPHATFKDYY